MLRFGFYINLISFDWRFSGKFTELFLRSAYGKDILSGKCSITYQGRFADESILCNEERSARFIPSNLLGTD